MEVVYLGLFQKVFNWVLSRILDPVYRFVSGLLTTVLSWIFETILAPLLVPLLQDVLEFFIDLWLTVWSGQLYMLMAGILKLVDYLETAFDIFIGLRPVTYTPAGGKEIEGTLLAALRQRQGEEKGVQQDSGRNVAEALVFLEENELTEDMKDKLIEKVLVYAEGRIEVVWKFGDNVKKLNIG